jgi:hypothetical protein
MNSDLQHKIIYVECNEHYRFVEQLRSTACPCVTHGGQLCNDRFSSNTALLKHMNDKHNGLTICKLCLEFRPLFISEHIVLTPAALKLHNKFGDTTVPSKGDSNVMLNVHKNKLNAGHKLCSFCKDYYYDSAMLYTHMQSVHHTCYMCPSNLMFRYYNTIQSLRDHYRSDHMICEICDQNPAVHEAGINVSFKDFREYSGHMREFHGIAQAQLMNSFRVGVGSNASSSRSSQQGGATSGPYIDLDMGTANPNYSGERQGGAGTGSVGNQDARGGGGGVVIPSNMQIAGRVTGSGRFAPLSQAELAMQRASEEANAALARGNKGNKTAFDSNFPSLGGGSSSATTAAPFMHQRATKKSTTSTTEGDFPSLGGGTVKAPPKPHPLSVINSRQQEAKVLQQKLKEKVLFC